MKENEKNLLDRFVEISSKKWIPGINSELNSAGLTLEKLLDKQPDSMFFPDFNGIEVKCSQRFSRHPISLFSKAFDGPNMFETNEILNRYSKPDTDFPEQKVIYTSLNCQKRKQVNDKYYFKLSIDKNEQRLYLEVYDINFNFLEREAYVEFKNLKSHLELKLNKLALVLASKKTIENQPYFRYYYLAIYQLKSFDKFIELLENNIIKVRFICRISRSGEEKGRQKNKNLVFQINRDDLNLLFDKIIEYNADEIASYNLN